MVKPAMHGRAKALTALLSLFAALTLAVAAPAQAAPPPDADPPGSHPGPGAGEVGDIVKMDRMPGKWRVASTGPQTETAVASTGEEITVTGVETVYVPADASAASDVSIAGTAGCTVTEYYSSVYKITLGYPTYKNGVEGYSWAQVSTGCPSYGESVKSELWEAQWYGQPTVAEGPSRTAYPGGARQYSYATYTCGSGSYQYRHWSYAGSTAWSAKMCP